MRVVFQILFFLMIVPLSVFSQKQNKKARKSYSEFDYAKVIELIEKNQDLDIDMLRKVADSYRMIGEYGYAEKCYSRIASSEKKTPTDVYAYAQILKMNSRYAEAAAQMDQYTRMKPDDSRVELYQINKRYHEKLLEDKVQFKIKNVGGNSYQQDFGVVYYKNKVVLASSRQNMEYVTRLWNGNRLPFLDMYSAKINAKNELKGLKKFSPFNKKYHEGPASFNKKGNLMIFTSDNYNGKSDEGVKNLKLYEATEKGGEWSEKISFPYNSEDYSCGHPALTPDGNTLYFASDMPGGLGGVDIYVTRRDANGEWTKPVNLGDKINTEGNEMFPYIHESGLFFFSSDGRPGLGGLDVFATLFYRDRITKVINVGVPVNTSKDDFSMILDAAKKKGFFSSNREDGKGSDDIYAYDLLKPFNFGKIVKGVAKDEKGNILPETAVYLTDKTGGILEKIYTDKSGEYFLFAEEGQFNLLAKRQKYFDDRKPLNTSAGGDTLVMNLTLEKDPGFTLLAKIVDSKSRLPLRGVTVKLTDKKGKVISAMTPATGEFTSELIDKKLGDTLRYKVEISRPGYVSKTIDLKWPLKKRGAQNIHESMDVSLSKVEVGGDLSKMSGLGNIYYDFGKWDIRPDAAAELDKIVRIMNENPGMVVELGSHTDCRSSKAYNLKLSENRAKASVKYIQKRISDPKRITGKGYGESKLLNNCACEGKAESTCTEDEHQKNRRTEFIILKQGK